LYSGVLICYLRLHLTGKRKILTKRKSSKSCAYSADESSYLLDQRRLKKELGEAHEKLNTAQNNFSECLKEVEKEQVNSLTKAAEKAQRDLFVSDTSQIATQIQNNLAEIAGLEKLYNQLSEKKRPKTGSTKAAVDLLDGYGDHVGIPRAPAQPTTDTRPDYWTSVYVDVASSHSSDTTKTDASSLTVDASIHYGLASVAASVSHNESHREAMKQMSNANVKINFDCMRVDITRPWLRGELFYDHDLRIPDDDPCVLRHSLSFPRY
jgi:hypothetical protein